MDDEKTNPSGAAQVDWPTLIDHKTCVQADELMERVYRKFQATEIAFMAVLDQERAIGLCARDEIGMKLGSQYGFSLYSRTPVREHMVIDPLFIASDQPWADVLQRVFSRTSERFHQDVLLVDGTGRFLGLITLQTLIRLQTRLLMGTIVQLEDQQAEISRRNRQMTEDLLMAREMQLAMLPRELPSVASGISTAQRAVRLLSHYAPLGIVSGDFFEVLAISDSEVGVFIADVMGHGVQAALVTAMLRALIQTHSPLATNPGAFLTALNSSFCEILQGCRLATFASAFALVADLSAGTLRYASAGHPNPILVRRKAHNAVPLECNGTSNGGILGVWGATRYGMGETSLAAGDVVFLFTDGLFEIRRLNGEMLGLDRLIALVAASLDQPTADLVPKLIEDAKNFSEQRQFEDDVCLVALEVRELAAMEPTSSK